MPVPVKGLVTGHFKIMLKKTFSEETMIATAVGTFVMIDKIFLMSSTEHAVNSAVAYEKKMIFFLFKLLLGKKRKKKVSLSPQ